MDRFDAVFVAAVDEGERYAEGTTLPQLSRGS
jgi:hypothetical protein